MPLNDEELQRYVRHFNLSEVGIGGQEKLKQAKVLCIGAGGLGSAAISYLAAAGIGQLGIIDNDIVELSNLQRQIIHNQASVGISKVISASRWISENNSHVKIIAYQQALTAENALNIIEHYDIVIDGTDNFASRYLINDACFLAKKPNIHASVAQFSGQIAVFCSENGTCYRCLFPQMPPQEAIPNCAQGGVLGVVPGMLGIMQATEALKLIIGCGESLINRLLTVDLLNMEFNTFTLHKNPNCELCGENPTIQTLEMTMPSANLALDDYDIDVATLRKQLQQNPGLLLVDVREPFELLTIPAIENAHHIPLNTIPANLDKLPRDASFVVYCKSGVRSLYAVKFLRDQGFTCHNLAGGIEAW